VASAHGKSGEREQAARTSWHDLRCEERRYARSRAGIRQGRPGGSIATRQDPGTLFAVWNGTEQWRVGMTGSSSARLLAANLSGDGARGVECWRPGKMRSACAVMLQPSPQIAHERRSHIRRPGDREVAVRALADPESRVRWASLQNVSRDGVGLLLSSRFAPGTRLLVQVPGVANALLPYLTVRVVYARPQACGNWSLGCRLDDGERT
jgi:hypothetical protein